MIIVLKNDYPIDFIFNTINVRLKIFIHKDTIQQKKIK